MRSWSQSRTAGPGVRTSSSNEQVSGSIACPLILQAKPSGRGQGPRSEPVGQPSEGGGKRGTQRMGSSRDQAGRPEQQCYESPANNAAQPETRSLVARQAQDTAAGLSRPSLLSPALSAVGVEAGSYGNPPGQGAELLTASVLFLTGSCPGRRRSLRVPILKAGEVQTQVEKQRRQPVLSLACSLCHRHA